MAPNALPFVNLFANSDRAADFRKNVRQQLLFNGGHNNNNNNNGCVSASFQHCLKSIKDRFVAVNRPFLTEQCLEAVGGFSPADAENARLAADDARALTAARLELVRKALVKRSVREKLEEWQKKKEEASRVHRRQEPRQSLGKDFAALAREDYGPRLDEIRKQAAARAQPTADAHRRRAVEICFRATVAAAVPLTWPSAADDAYRGSLESRLQRLRAVDAAAVGEPALAEAERLLEELAAAHGNGGVRPRPGCSLNKFSVNVPGDRLVKHVRRQYVALVKNNKTLMNHLAAVDGVPFAGDAAAAPFRRDALKAINTLVNTVSSCSAAHMADKRDRLDALLGGRPVRAADVLVMAGRNGEALAYCAHALSRKMVEHAERVASVNVRAAHDVAAVATELWAAHQRFGKVLYAELKRKCPLLTPYCYPVAKGLADGQPDRGAFGYKTDSAGVFESDAEYAARMTGVVRLYAALVVASVRRDAPVVGLSQAWIFVAGTLNQNPVADVTATLLAEFLSIVGPAMARAYGKQFVKLLRYIDTIYMKKIAVVTPAGHGGPVARLNGVVSKCLRYGGSSFEGPEGTPSPDLR